MKKYAPIEYVDCLNSRQNLILHRIDDNEVEINRLKNEVRVLRELYKKSGFWYQLLHWR